MQKNLIKDGKYYNIYTATLICQVNSHDGISRYYKSKSGIYFRTGISRFKLNPTREDERIELEVGFDNTKTILEACQTKAPYFGDSQIFEVPEEFTKIVEV